MQPSHGGFSCHSQPVCSSLTRQHLHSTIWETFQATVRTTRLVSRNIRTKEGIFPYVSAQSFRYWHRVTLQERVPGWRAAPIYREEKIAYTDSNPLLYWDDDLFGYMRAPSKRESAKVKREADTSRVGENRNDKHNYTCGSLPRQHTRLYRSCLSHQRFGTMSRHEGNPVPHEHQFYRASLRGLFSLDLHACGTFSYRDKTGFRNLDDERINRLPRASSTSRRREIVSLANAGAAAAHPGVV